MRNLDCELDVRLPASPPRLWVLPPASYHSFRPDPLLSHATQCRKDTALSAQLLVLDMDGTFFERLFIKGPEGFHRIRCILIELLEPSEILHIKHVSDCIVVLGKAPPGDERHAKRVLVLRLGASRVTPKNAREWQNLIHRKRA